MTRTPSECCVSRPAEAGRPRGLIANVFPGIRMRRWIGTVAVVMCVGCTASAQPQEKQPPADETPRPSAPQPAAPREEPPPAAAPAQKPAAAEASLTADSTVDQILDALDARGKNLEAFTADVSLTEGDVALANEVTRRGQVLYQSRDGRPRLRVTFTERDTGNRIFEEKIEYLLEDGWLIDRTYAKHIEVRRQVLRPGEKLDLLKLGEGPFPLPIGQKKESVHEQFDAAKIAPAKDDLAGSVHVQLVPRPATQFARKFDVIDVWVDPKTNMPARIDTAQGETVRSTELTNFKANPHPPLVDGDFALPAIDEGVWDLHSEPFAE